MKVLILNSGTGTRMGELTQNHPKCLLKLNNGENIFSRQLKAIEECNLTDIIVTTGKHKNELIKQSKQFSKLKITFVNNPLYATTNYIYSIYLAKQHLDDDIILIHGDLVFDKTLLSDIIANPKPSLCLINKQIPLPLKDFKGRIENGYLKQVSIDIFDDNCHALFPLYKLSKQSMQIWLDEITAFVEKGITNVYAENALNSISENLSIKPMLTNGHYINEIDTPEDYVRVKNEVFMADNNTYFEITALKNLLEKYNAKRPFAIMGRHLQNSSTDAFLNTLNADLCKYFNVKENPTEESVLDAQNAFEQHNADLLISIGGGSAIDTAKAVKYNLLLRNPEYSKLAHIAIPTTAGSGSEATRFSVITYGGSKCSLTHDLILPESAILDSTLLYSMNAQQRKVSLIDALCHSVESLLSRNATEESKRFATLSIKIILENYKAFATNNTAVFDKIFTASNYAGRAINISKTAFGHALSYTLTTEYGIQHGQAVAICLIHALKYAENTGNFADELKHLSSALLCDDNQTPSQKLNAIYYDMDMMHPFDLSSANAKNLAQKVNAERVNNAIISFKSDDLCAVYADIISNYT